MGDIFIRKALQLAGFVKLEERPIATDWVRVERDLGVVLPNDYKEFISEFGSGRFGDIELFNPCAKGWHRLGRDELIAYKGLNAALLKNMDQRIYPDEGGLIWIATSGSQLEFFLDAKDLPRSSKAVMIDLGSFERTNLDTTLAEFLCKLYCNEWPGFQEMRETVWFNATPQFFSPISTHE